MPTYELSLTLKQDGANVPGFPILRRVEVDESQASQVEVTNSVDTATWGQIQGGRIDTLNFLFIASDRAVTLRLDDQSDAVDRSTIPLNAGGVLVLIDTTIDAGGGSSNARVNNNSGAIANIKALLGGT